MMLQFMGTIVPFILVSAVYDDLMSRSLIEGLFTFVLSIFP